MSDLYLYNTLTRKKELFKPLHDNEVRMYTCGPTVYNYAHIGNLRTYIFEDILRRVLEYNGFTVKHVENITDVGHLTDDADQGEDKVEKMAREKKMTAWEIAEFFTKKFQEDIKQLNIKEPHIWCKATDHIADQIETIKKIEKAGYTYRTSDGIYFDTSKLENYGELARLDSTKLKAGARVAMGEKKNPTDFALWKFSPQDKKRQMEWDSPWGKGFPGWHIECSTMSTKYLGVPFDIHCGGIDHIPVHHTNEIAQTWAAEGKKMANFWLHGEFLVIDEQRMGKSAGNFITLQTLIDKGYHPLAYRYFVLNAHYRQKLNFSWEGLDFAQHSLNNLYKSLAQLPEPISEGCGQFEEKFLKAINDDLNTPQALAVMWEMLKSSNCSPEQKVHSLFKFDEVLGLKLKDKFQELKNKTANIPEQIKELLKTRQQARQNKQWELADKIRDEINALGYIVEDTPEGQQIKPKQ